MMHGQKNIKLNPKFISKQFHHLTAVWTSERQRSYSWIR